MFPTQMLWSLKHHKIFIACKVQTLEYDGINSFNFMKISKLVMLRHCDSWRKKPKVRMKKSYVCKMN